MSDQQADNGGVTSYKFHADQCTETATKNECRFAGKRTDQPRNSSSTPVDFAGQTSPNRLLYGG